MAINPKLALVGLSKMASTPEINFIELFLRFIIGIAIAFYADATDYPDLLRVIGIFLSISALIIISVPRKWHANYAQWWAKRIPAWFVRTAAPISFFAGAFLIKSIL